MGIEQAANAQHGHLSFACVPTIAGTRLPALAVAAGGAFRGHVRAAGAAASEAGGLSASRFGGGAWREHALA